MITLLTAVVLLLGLTPPRSVRRTGRRPTPQHARPTVPRPRTPTPSSTAPVDYEAFCEVAIRHRDLWAITHDPSTPTPYVARHKPNPDITLAASRVDVLDAVLTEFTPPAYARPYLPDRAERDAWEQEKRELADLVRQVAS